MLKDSPYQVALIDAHTLLRDCLALAIQQHSRFKLLGVFESLKDPAFLQFQKDRAQELDLILTDVLFEGATGFGKTSQSATQDEDWLSWLKLALKRMPRSKCLVLMGELNPDLVKRLLQGVVNGIIPKNEPWEMLEDAMLEVMSGGSYFPADLIRLQHTHQDQNDASVEDRVLSEREKEILTQVAKGSTSRNIAAQLGLSPRSVETYRLRIMRKLGITSMAGLIGYALRHGLSGGFRCV